MEIEIRITVTTIKHDIRVEDYKIISYNVIPIDHFAGFGL